jgi:hypothetical protein
MAHRKISEHLPLPEDVLSGKVTTLKTKEISAMYSLAVSLCYTLQDSLKHLNNKPNDDWHAMLDNFLKFCMDNFTTELTVMSARIAVVNYSLPFITNKLKNFQEFYSRFGKYIMNANNN